MPLRQTAAGTVGVMRENVMLRNRQQPVGLEQLGRARPPI